MKEMAVLALITRWRLNFMIARRRRRLEQTRGAQLLWAAILYLACFVRYTPAQQDNGIHVGTHGPSSFSLCHSFRLSLSAFGAKLDRWTQVFLVSDDCPV